jgi:hypothetical protein
MMRVHERAASEVLALVEVELHDALVEGERRVDELPDTEHEAAAYLHLVGAP